MQTVQDLKSKLLEYARGDKSTAGRLFERFIKRFLRTHTFWGNVFNKIWARSLHPLQGGDELLIDKIQWCIIIKVRCLEHTNTGYILTKNKNIHLPKPVMCADTEIKTSD
ncbi:MAG: hypothetical protein ACK4GE_06400 [Caldimicrobium sp.]